MGLPREEVIDTFRWGLEERREIDAPHELDASSFRSRGRLGAVKATASSVAARSGVALRAVRRRVIYIAVD